MIIIFDTAGGLCNQFYDIDCGIKFCIKNEIKFSFRYCHFREGLHIFYNKKFSKLFDTQFLRSYNLYCEYDTLLLTEENTYNLESISCVHLFTYNYLNEIKSINKEFIILKQFSGLYVHEAPFNNHIYADIMPSSNLIDIYNSVKNKTINDEYNFIHYRYEEDFTQHFNIKVEDLKTLILRIKPKFNNPNLKVYIATTNIKQLICIDDKDLCDLIITKDESYLIKYNFEEKAFIDYMFGMNSNEVFGHSKSSFSYILNHNKHTDNYYDRVI